MWQSTQNDSDVFNCACLYIFTPSQKIIWHHSFIHSYILIKTKYRSYHLASIWNQCQYWYQYCPYWFNTVPLHRIPYWSGPQFTLISVEIKTSVLNTIILSTGHARKQQKTVSIKCLRVFHKYVVKCDISRRLLPLLCNTGILNLVLCHSGYLKLKKCLCSCVHQSEQRQETKQEKRKKIIAMHGLGKGCNFFC